MDDGYISNGKSTPSYCSFNTTNKIKPQQAVEQTLRPAEKTTSMFILIKQLIMLKKHGKP